MAEFAKERQIPLILLGVGILLYGISAFVHTGPRGVVPVLITVIIVGIIQTILLVAAAFLLAMITKESLGEVQPAILKFAGAVICSGGFRALVAYGQFGSIAASLVFFGLILWLFELDRVYAIILLAINYLLSLFVVSVILAALR